MKTEPNTLPASARNYVHARARSFVYAFQGLRFFFRTGANARIQLLLFGLLLALGILLGVTPVEGTLLLLMSASVFAAEIFNTCLELLLDHVTPGFHPLVGRIKDLAAGAVLLLSVAALVVGLLIFIPKLFP